MIQFPCPLCHQTNRVTPQAGEITCPSCGRVFELFVSEGRRKVRLKKGAAARAQRERPKRQGRVSVAVLAALLGLALLGAGALFALKASPPRPQETPSPTPTQTAAPSLTPVPPSPTPAPSATPTPAGFAGLLAAYEALGCRCRGGRSRCGARLLRLGATPFGAG